MSFSWRRALGVSAAKARLSRKIGIPLTRAGRERKLGRAMGCMVPIALALCTAAAAAMHLMP
jgi:hypothetical protein